MNTTEHPTVVDPLRRTIRPTLPEDEDFFGLAAGSNGTGPECRRRLVEPEGKWTWLRPDGRVAPGPYLLGTGEECLTVQAITWDRRRPDAGAYVPVRGW